MSLTVTGVGLMSFSKTSKPLMLFLDGLCDLLWSSLVIFFGVLNSFCQDFSNYTNSVVIEVSLCFQDLSLSPLFTNYNKKGWEMRKKTNKKKILKAHWNSNDNIIDTVKKIIRKRIQQYLRRSPIVIGVNHTNCSR
jgi:hypothetical protein